MRLTTLLFLPLPPLPVTHMAPRGLKGFIYYYSRSYNIQNNLCCQKILSLCNNIKPNRNKIKQVKQTITDMEILYIYIYHIIRLCQYHGCMYQQPYTLLFSLNYQIGHYSYQSINSLI